MATNDLKVDQLWAEITKRRLTIAVRILEAAIRDDSEKSEESKGLKRQRDSIAKDSDLEAPPLKIKVSDKLCSMTVKQHREKATSGRVSAADYDNVPSGNDQVKEGKKENADSNATQTVKAIDELQRMKVKQLREEATRRGISASGTKKKLLDRLWADNDSYNGPAMKKGCAVLDKCLPDHIKAQYHVLQVGGEIYDARLNQTNIGENNNKFFVIQVLESDDGGRFVVYFRWGRVGVNGRDKLNGPYASQQAAISEFVKKFFDKTKNHWLDRKNFVRHPRSYTWLEMDYSETKNEPPFHQKLEARVAKFIALICNTSMMRRQMMEIGYNAEKLPLGKLSKSTILKGYDVLKRIADVIGQADTKTLEQLSGEFYTVFPHDFGVRKTSMTQFIIDTPQKLKSKLQMVEALGEIEVAMKLIEDDTDAEDPLYSHYRQLHCELTPLEVHSEEYSMIEKYMKNTPAKRHSDYDVDIIQIFKVSREGEAERFHKFSRTKNRMLLWHGSRLANWTGILSKGLRIAPPEAPLSGYTFGKGIYFADMFSRSASYCCYTKDATAGVLLLCEVALGDMAELLTTNVNADKLPPGKLSTKGVGLVAPDSSEAQMLEDGVIVPLGRPKEQPGRKGSLHYNEYIVYNVEQIRMRYLVHVNFNFKHLSEKPHLTPPLPMPCLDARLSLAASAVLPNRPRLGLPMPRPGVRHRLATHLALAKPPPTLALARPIYRPSGAKSLLQH